MARNQDNKQLAKKATNPVTYNLQVQQLRRTSQDIASWRSAMKQAENELNPNRVKLYELYNDVLLDGRLLALVQKRCMNITNNQVILQDAQKQPMDNEALLSATVKSPWLFDTLKYSIESVIWGHSLIEFEVQKNEIKNAFLVPRQNVRPEFQDILLQAGNTANTINYTESPNDNYLLSMGSTKGLGLLLSASQYVIYKRGAFGDWAQYAQLFGMPFRKGKYKAFDTQTRTLLERALADMGSAAYAVIPEEADIDIIPMQGSGDSSSIYNELRKACNEELAILLLGQTMTTSDGSSRSQAEVHMKVEESITLSDMIWLQYNLNHRLKPMLITHGYPVQDLTMQFPDLNKLPAEKQLKMIIDINDHISPVDPAYVEKTFGVPLAQKQPIDGNKPIEKKKNLSLDTNQALSSFYENSAIATLPHRHTQTSPHCHVTASEESPMESFFDAVANGLHKGDLTKDSIPEGLYTTEARYLMAGITKNWSNDTINYTHPDNLFLAHLQHHTFAFSAAKSLQQMQEMSKLLTDENGNARDFNGFKQAVKPIYDNFNQHWLLSEYNLAVAASQMASQYRQYLSTADTFPYLKYQTVGDEQVRHSHAILDGKIIPIADDFWNTYYPPNGWGCRCDVIQLDETEVNTDDITSGDDAGKLGKNVMSAKDRKFFGKNWGNTPQWFDNHPYFTDTTDPYTLTAVRNYGMKEPDKLPQTPTPKTETINKADFIALWDNYIVNDGINETDFQIKSITGAWYKLDKATKKHLLTHKNKAGEYHYRYFNRLEDVINSPTEVWLSKTGGARGIDHNIVHIKTYKDVAIVAFINPDTLICTTMYEVPITNQLNHFRTGILLYR